MALLKENFSGRIISRLSDGNWPPRFDTVDLFCEATRDLENHQVIANIPLSMSQKGVENYFKRMEICKYFARRSV